MTGVTQRAPKPYVPAGLDAAQREVVLEALADAIAYREPAGWCAGCETDPGGMCDDHAADELRAAGYRALLRDLEAGQ